MITLRTAADRGHGQHGWLDSRHTFSFADYHDPAEMGWGVLRVINEDRVAPGMGFGTHGHRDMEIVSYVLQGALAHRDSMGNGTVIRPGEVQRMSAGSGVMHSEFNASQHEPVHFLQIWIQPAARGGAPGYAQQAFPEADRRGRLRLVVSPDGRDDSITLGQDALVFAGLLEAGERTDHHFAAGRLGYLHVARGQVEINDMVLNAGDGAKIADEADITLTGRASAELLLFDLPPAR